MRKTKNNIKCNSFHQKPKQVVKWQRERERERAPAIDFEKMYDFLF